MTEDQEVVVLVLAQRYCETARRRRGNEHRRRSHDYVSDAARLDELACVLGALTEMRPGMVRRAASLTFEEHPIESGPDWVKVAGRDLTDYLLSMAANGG